MKLSKILIAAVVVAIFNILVGMVTCGGVFSWVYKIEPVNVWKPMQEVSLPLLILSTFLINILFVYIYALINSGIPGRNRFVKGSAYGLCVWVVGIIPGMVDTSLFMTVAPVVVIYWTIWGLIVLPLKGLIAAAIYGE